MKYENLFESVSIGKVKIKNRFFMAPMFPFGMADASGMTTRQYSDYYVDRARGGVGLIITGLCKADNTSEIMRPVFACVNDPMQYLQSTAPMVERIHAFGAKIFLQISAGWGRALWPEFADALVGVDEGVANRHNPSIKQRQITTEEIQRIIAGFGKTAFVAKLCGFDGVEVHAVHEGYLLDQFGTEFFNHRTDQYGGSFENRYRFAVEVMQTIKKACGKDFPVSVRYSPKHFMRGEFKGAIEGEEFKEVGRDLDEGIKAAKYLVEQGYDALNVDVGCYDSHYWNHPTVYSKDGLYVPYAAALKEAVDVPILCAGRMDDPELSSRTVAEGKIDMVGLGRTLLADPYYPIKLQTGREDEICWCLNCNVGCGSKLLQTGHLGCAVNPRCGYEPEQGLAGKVQERDNMVVVGGGPGGMEAAVTAAKRGYHVILLEKSDSLGGNLKTASKADFKYRDEKYIRYFEHALAKAGVDVRLNTEATPELIKELPCDVLILATGSHAIVPKIQGYEKKQYMSAAEALNETDKVGQNVVIIGGGQVGIETGIWLSQNGRTVTVVEMLSALQPNAAPHVRQHAEEIMRVRNIPALTEATVTEIQDAGVAVQKKDGETIVIPADTVVYAVGYRAEDTLYKEMARSGMEVYNIGDSDLVSNVYNAVHNAYDLVNRL